MAYRSELRELNEINFARFDSRLEQRIAESEARLGQRMTELDARLRQEMAEFRTEVRTEMANLRADMMKWMFLYWVGTALTVIGLSKF